MSQALIEKARAFYLAGNFGDALQVLDIVLAMDPMNAGVWNNRGTALAELKRLEEAQASFARAVALNPSFTAPLLNRANALLALARYDEAANDYEKALALDPSFPYARGNLLHCRLQCCDWRNFEEQKMRLTAELRSAKPVSPLIST